MPTDLSICDGCNPFASCLDPLSNLHWLPALCLSQLHLLAEPSSEPQASKWTCPYFTVMNSDSSWLSLRKDNTQTSFNTNTNNPSPLPGHSPDSPEGTTSPGTPAQKENQWSQTHYPLDREKLHCKEGRAHSETFHLIWVGRMVTGASWKFLFHLKGQMPPTSR